MALANFSDRPVSSVGLKIELQTDRRVHRVEHPPMGTATQLCSAPASPNPLHAAGIARRCWTSGLRLWPRWQRGAGTT